MADELDAAGELARLLGDPLAADNAVVAPRRYSPVTPGRGRAPARTCSRTCCGPTEHGYSRHPNVPARQPLPAAIAIYC